jgi:hypothetical protein
MRWISSRESRSPKAASNREGQIAPVIFCAIVVLGSMRVAAEDLVPNGRDAFVKENAVNIPVGTILLARQKNQYCAVQFTSASWSKEETHASYKSWFIGDPTRSSKDRKVKPREDQVYQKEPLSIVGRVAAARSQDKVFCKKLTLKWSGAQQQTAWIYFDEGKTLELAPTTWQDIGEVNVQAATLRWFKYGDVSQARGYVSVPIR